MENTTDVKTPSAVDLRRMLKAFHVFRDLAPTDKDRNNLHDAALTWFRPFEELPVRTGNPEFKGRDGFVFDPTLQNCSPSYYVLAGGEWWPAVGHETSKGWICFGINYEDGTQDAGVAQLGKWAHVCADDTPSVPLF